MKRILFLLFAVGLSASMTVMAGMSTGKVRKETRFLTDKMAYELSLSTQQYNDAYEINYDFIYSVRNIMDYVARGYEWALDDYYEALDIRNDDLRWVLSDVQYRRFMGADYFYRPIYVTGGRWSFRVYVNYPNRNLFYFGVPSHYRTYCGAHYRPYIHLTSYYRGRYTNFHHYSTPHRVRDQRVYHSYRRSDFGSVHFRPNSSTRPHNAPTRPGVAVRPGNSTRPSNPSGNRKPNKDVVPDRNNNRGEGSSNRRPETNSGSSNSGRRPASGNSATSGSNRESGRTNSSSTVSSSRRSESISSGRNNSSERNNRSSSRRNNSSSSRSSGNSSSNRSSSGSSRDSNAGSTRSSSSSRSNSSTRNNGSSRSNVSSGQTERRSSSGSTRSNSSSSSRSSERSNGSRR